MSFCPEKMCVYCQNFRFCRTNYKQKVSFQTIIFARNLRFMQRYFVELSFKGTRYHGWQVQPNALSVQEVLETTFGTFLRHPVEITGAGRTDTGVHASFYVAHFEAESLPFSAPDLVEKLNRFLPSDIALHRIWPVGQDAHARFSAIKRTYHYFISRRKDPFSLETSYQYLMPLDVEAMNEAAAKLLLFSDFTSFSKLHTDVKTNNCRVFSAAWKQEGHKLVFTITADRFLRNMVRAIVGTLLEVGRQKLTTEGFVAIIERKDRSVAGTSAPPQGLFLAGIEYPEQIFL
jgi:tRNA pseudouridine38-40 synthase